MALLTKCDLAAAGFDREAALGNVQHISHHARVFELSAKAGEGMAAWLNSLAQQHAAVKR